MLELLKEYEIYRENVRKYHQISEHHHIKMMDIHLSEIDAYLHYHRNLSFNERLFLLIDRTHQKDSDVYKKAHIDRRLFSKIRSNKKYVPSKKTVIALCLALELNKDEADDLLSSAGYYLSDAKDYDLIIQFCIEKKIFHFYEVNELLEHYGFDIL